MLTAVMHGPPGEVHVDVDLMLLPDEAGREEARQLYGSADSALWLRARGWAVLFGVMLLDTGLAGNARSAALGEQVLRRI